MYTSSLGFTFMLGGFTRMPCPTLWLIIHINLSCIALSHALNIYEKCLFYKLAITIEEILSSSCDPLKRRKVRVCKIYEPSCKVYDPVSNQTIGMIYDSSLQYFYWADFVHLFSLRERQKWLFYFWAKINSTAFLQLFLSSLSFRVSLP